MHGASMSANGRAFPDIVVARRESTMTTEPEPGLARTILAYNEKLLLAEHHMTKGWVGNLHSHAHEQIVYIVSGHLRVMCQGDTFEVTSGDSFVVRGGITHGAAALEDSVVVDVFTPCREDYLR
jgi:quercetin dioxygenase-like cupin family protein